MSLRRPAVEAVPDLLIARPVHPLRAIDRPQIAPARREGLILDDPRLERVAVDFLARGLAVTVQRPVGPDMHALPHQFADVGVAGQEPQPLPREIGRASWRARVWQYV